MNREVDLLSYLPPYMQEYAEMKAIQEAVQPEVQHLDDQSEKLLNNIFITTSDIDGLKKYESMLGIVPGPNDSLDVRIQRVIMRWNNMMPYTYKALITRLTAMCGIDKFDVSPDFGNYKLDIVVELNTKAQVDELDNILGMMMPANILYVCKNMHVKLIDASLFTATATVNSTHFEINSYNGVPQSIGDTVDINSVLYAESVPIVEKLVEIY